MKLAALVIAGFLAVSTNAAPNPLPQFGGKDFSGVSDIMSSKTASNAPSPGKLQDNFSKTPAAPGGGPAAAFGGVEKSMSKVGGPMDGVSNFQKGAELAGAEAERGSEYGGLPFPWNLLLGGNKDFGSICNSIVAADWPRQFENTFNFKEAFKQAVTSVTEILTNIQNEAGLCSTEPKLTKLLNQLTDKLEKRWFPDGDFNNEIDTAGNSGPGTGASKTSTGSSGAVDSGGIFDLLNLIPGFEEDGLGSSSAATGPEGKSGTNGGLDGMLDILQLIQGGPGSSSEPSSGKPGSGINGDKLESGKPGSKKRSRLAGLFDFVHLISTLSKSSPKSGTDSKPAGTSKANAAKSRSNAGKSESGLGKPGVGSRRPGVGSGKPGASPAKPEVNSDVPRKPGTGYYGKSDTKYPGKPGTGNPRKSGTGYAGTEYAGTGYTGTGFTGTGYAGTSDEQSGVNVEQSELNDAGSGSTRPRSRIPGSRVPNAEEPSYLQQDAEQPETEWQDAGGYSEGTNAYTGRDANASNAANSAYAETPEGYGNAETAPSPTYTENAESSAYGENPANSAHAENPEIPAYGQNFGSAYGDSASIPAYGESFDSPANADSSASSANADSTATSGYAENPTSSAASASASNAETRSGSNTSGRKYSPAVAEAIARAKSAMAARNGLSGARQEATGYSGYQTAANQGRADDSAGSRATSGYLGYNPATAGSRSTAGSWSSSGSRGTARGTAGSRAGAGTSGQSTVAEQNRENASASRAGSSGYSGYTGGNAVATGRGRSNAEANSGNYGSARSNAYAY